MDQAHSQIRAFTQRDLEPVCELLRQLWPDKVVSASGVASVIDAGLKANSQVFLCAIVDQRVIGFGSLTLKRNLWNEGLVAFVDELVVDKDYRGKGIGTEILTALEAEAKNRACKRIELDSAFHRKEAHQFYLERGFESRAFLFSKMLAQ